MPMSPSSNMGSECATQERAFQPRFYEKKKKKHLENKLMTIKTVDRVLFKQSKDMRIKNKELLEFPGGSVA